MLWPGILDPVQQKEMLLPRRFRCETHATFFALKALGRNTFFIILIVVVGLSRFTVVAGLMHFNNTLDDNGFVNSDVRLEFVVGIRIKVT